MNRSQTRSQRPAALQDADLDEKQGASATQKSSGRTNAEKAAALLLVYVLLHSEADRTFLESLLSPEAAIKRGARENPQVVFNELVEALALWAPWIKNRKFVGYGPRRARFTAELANKVVGPLDAFNAAESNERFASKEATQARTLTEPARQDAVFAVQSLFTPGDAAHARFAVNTATGTTHDARLVATGQVVEEVRAVRANVPASILEDAGLTPEALDALEGQVQRAGQARTRYRDGRTTRKAMRSDLAASVGRMVFELRLLVTAAKRARRRDPSIPSFTATVVASRPKAAKKKPAANPQPVAPPPVATPPVATPQPPTG